MAFVKATKKQAKARIAIFGPSGAGKTYTSLILARELAAGGKVAVIDTESGSASKYADEFEFDTTSLTDFSPQSFIDAMEEAQAMGYAAIVVDSLSHAWMGRGGVLEIVDNATARSKSHNAFTTGWKEATPQHNRLIEAIVGCRCHLIVTMRSKTEYVIDESSGKKTPRKVGLAPVQRDGMEYEFDIVGDMDVEANRLVISKSRCKALSGGVFVRPDAKFANVIIDWLNAGEAVTELPHDAAEPDEAEQATIRLSDLIMTASKPAETERAILAKEGVDAIGRLSADRVAYWTQVLAAKATGKAKQKVFG